MLLLETLFPALSSTVLITSKAWTSKAWLNFINLSTICMNYDVQVNIHDLHARALTGPPVVMILDKSFKWQRNINKGPS